MRMIDEDDLEEKTEDTRYSKIRPEAPGVWAKDSIPNIAIIGNCTLGKVQVSRLKAPSGGGGGVKIQARRCLQPGL